MTRLLCLLCCLAPLAAEPLLQQNFDQIADGGLPAEWRVEGGKWAVQGGELRAEPTGYISKIVLPLGEIPDVALEVTARFTKVKNDARWLALMVRQPKQQEAPFLIFTSRFDRTKANGTEIGFRTGDAGWNVLRTAAAPVPPVLDETHMLRVEVRGHRVRGLIDGQETITAFLPGTVPTTGEIGLIVSDVSAVFDNLTVEALPPADPADEPPLTGRPRPLVIGHRGYHARAPENTLVAIREAFDAGADAVEIDLARTADGHLVLLHDRTVDRTTDGRGAIAELTLEQVRKLDAGSWKDQRYAGEPVPTFDEALATAAGRGPLLLDLKAEGLLELISSAVRAKGMLDQVVLCCWTNTQAADARRHLPEAPACKLGSVPNNLPADWFANLLGQGLRALSLNYQSLSPEVIRAAHLRAMPVYAWTVNDAGSMTMLAAMGVDGILTDDPVLALKARAAQP